MLREAYGAHESEAGRIPDVASLRRRLDRSRQVERRALSALSAMLVVLIGLAALAIRTHTESPVPARGGPLDVGVVSSEPASVATGSYSAPVRAEVDAFAREHGTHYRWYVATGDGSRQISEAATRFRTVLVAGAHLQNSAVAAARQHPDTHFFLLDGTVEDRSNVSTLPITRVGTSFVAGAVAAAASKTGHVAAVFADEGPVTTAIVEAFRAGAKAERPAMTVSVGYPASGSAGVPAAAEDLLSSGADVLFGDPALLPAIGVARGQGKPVWYVGLDADYAAVAPAPLRPFVLTSVVPRLDLLAKQSLQAVAAGSPASVDQFAQYTSVIGLTTTGGHLAPYSEALNVPQTSSYGLRYEDGSPFAGES
jgi:basic membrane protein A